ncbi:unnamed protein product [Adineta steineri]|uniref:RRM domain-containing protein n=1 Tax=Adineta steineri TaxID=433720 RepID=A0A814VQC9_9BILA|nr:unnamed protein product [Adineta steineri]CAF3793616.1 unnamed protein product [Adineta steineri]
MTSNFNQSSLRNPSLCVYIGNTSSFDDQILIDYCSKFGTIVSCSIDNCPNEKRIFCDFHIVEFATKQQLESFFNKPIHQIDSIILDVKLYEKLIENFEILNIDRKLFIGPIIDLNDINIITEFYKQIDPILQYYISSHGTQTYVLIEFSNRQHIRTIIQQQIIPKTVDNKMFAIHTAIHPKEFINKKLFATNSQSQICINGITDQITEKMLIDYFEKRASVIACHILSTDPKCAIVQFANDKCTQKFLDISIIRFYETTLSISKVPDHLTSTLLPCTNDKETEVYYNDDEIDELLEATRLNSIHSLAIQNEPILPLQSIEPMRGDSPEISECGWASPPRTVINHCLPVDQPAQRLSSQPCITTMDINTDAIYQTIVIDTDIKPIHNSINNILHFVEEFQKQLEQIKDEYMMKFSKDRVSIERELNQLINEEQIAFEKIHQQLCDFRRRSSTKYYDHKRKYS